VDIIFESESALEIAVLLRVILFLLAEFYFHWISVLYHSFIYLISLITEQISLNGIILT